MASRPRCLEKNSLLSVRKEHKVKVRKSEGKKDRWKILKKGRNKCCVGEIIKE
jgi:hypothetical protein